MQGGDATMLCKFVLHLLQRYAAYNQGQTSVVAAVRLRAEAAQEACRSCPGAMTHPRQSCMTWISLQEDGSQRV